MFATMSATVGPAAAVASALLAAGIGDLVWVEGVVGAEVSTLARARLAAVLPNPRQRSPSGPSARSRAILDGAETIARDGRAACF